MNNSLNFFTNKQFIDTINSLLFVVTFFTFNPIHKPVAAYPNRREAAAKYKICESEKDIIDKIFCMRSLRRRLGDYENDDYVGSLHTASKQQLRAIYRRERKRAQVKIARLPIDN